MRRFKLHVRITLPAFFVGHVSATSASRDAREAATFPRRRFDGKRADALSIVKWAFALS